MSTALPASWSASWSSYNYASAEISRSPVSSKARVYHFNSVRRTELTSLNAAFTACRKLTLPHLPPSPPPSCNTRYDKQRKAIARSFDLFSSLTFAKTLSASARQTSHACRVQAGRINQRIWIANPAKISRCGATISSWHAKSVKM